MIASRIFKMRAIEFERLMGATGLIVQSAIYETSPVDCEPGAQNFYNAVIEVGFENRPTRFWKRCKKSSALWEGADHALTSILSPGERTQAPGESNRSRTIDLDLLYCGQ